MPKLGTYRVTDKDKGYRKLVEATLGMRKAEVKVGIFEKKGSKKYPEEDATVLDVATWNHFGVPGRIPARPFISLYFDESADRMQKIVKAALLQVFKGKFTAEVALARAGMQFVGDIQRAIPVGYFGAYPENSQKTIELKTRGGTRGTGQGFATPLIDTGQLRSSITYVVRFKGKDTEGSTEGATV